MQITRCVRVIVDLRLIVGEKECREVCVLSAGTPDKEGFNCKTRCAAENDGCKRICLAVTSHSIDLEKL